MGRIDSNPIVYNAPGQTTDNAMRATPFAPPSAPRQVWRQSPLARVLVLEKFRVCAFEHGRVTAETLGFLRTIQNPLTSFMKSKSEMQRTP